MAYGLGLGSLVPLLFLNIPQVWDVRVNGSFGLRVVENKHHLGSTRPESLAVSASGFSENKV